MVAMRRWCRMRSCKGAKGQRMGRPGGRAGGLAPRRDLLVLTSPACGACGADAKGREERVQSGCRARAERVQSEC